MTLGQQESGFLTDNEAESATYFCKTPECLVTFLDLGIVKFSFSRSKLLCVSSSACADRVIKKCGP